jgi:uncharacterized surface protein with fasciclin (FAS1) repeats
MKTQRFAQFAILSSFTACSVIATAADTAVVEKPSNPIPATNIPMVEKGSLSAVIADSVTFSTLKKALAAAELEATLGAKGAYTVFAPTDEAFDKLPAGLLGKLMLPENKEKLRSLLLYHVIAGKMLAADLKDGAVKTMNGEKVEIDVEGENIEVDHSKVFTADVQATNGVMHSIGTVIIPKSLKDFSPLDR